ncbi:hypothetical protein [Pantoea agglomerans]
MTFFIGDKSFYKVNAPVSPTQRAVLFFAAGGGQSLIGGARDRDLTGIAGLFRPAHARLRADKVTGISLCAGAVG